MTHAASYLVISLVLVAIQAPAANGPAGATGACSHVIGPIGTDGKPIGFSCTDIGGSALLVWNASQLGTSIKVNGGIKTLSFFSKSFLLDGSFVSDGPVAFIGNRTIKVTGSVTGTSVVIASLATSENDLKTSFLAPAIGRVTSTSTFPVEITAAGKVQATNGNLIVSGSIITNSGNLIATNGTVMLKTGSRLDVSWDDVNWVEGVHTDSVPHTITNIGEIKAANVIMEAHRANSTSTSIFNNGKVSATDTVTFVTAHPGAVDGLGNYSPGSFGISNTTGRIFAAKVVVSPYSQATPGGGSVDRTFVTTNATDKAQLQTDLGGQVFDPTQDNTPTSTSAAVIDSTQTGSFTTTSNIVVPQLAPSMTHLNATSNRVTPTLALAKGGSEQIRGDSTQPTAPKTKPRGKAKPVLVRGAFFGSKISAVITSNP